MLISGAVAKERSDSLISVGIVGAGSISSSYRSALLRFRHIHVVGVADRTGSQGLKVEDVVRADGPNVLVNLTPPQAHEAVTAAALALGQSVYSEKPLALTSAGAAALIEIGESTGARIAVAPATWLGPRVQTARQLIDAGELGTIMGGQASIIYSGPDLWHPSPAALFQLGAGPLFDMGIYPLSILLALLGPVASVAACADRARVERSARSQGANALPFPVEVPTHVVSLLRFVSGPVVTLTTSFDATGSRCPGLEIFGERASLSLNRPNAFDGSLYMTRSFGDWAEVPSALPDWDDAMRVAGLLDLVDCLHEERPPLCDPNGAKHLIATMAAVLEAAERRSWVDVPEMVGRPRSLDVNRYTEWRSKLDMTTSEEASA